MTNPISVLLIIGAAVVGPIDGKPAQYGPGDPRCKDVMREPTKYPAGAHVACAGGFTAKVVKEAETLPQLCERAMWEIGAIPVMGATCHGECGDRLFSTVLYWSLDTGETSVRCIPTPTGYRK